MSYKYTNSFGIDAPCPHPSGASHSRFVITTIAKKSASQHGVGHAAFKVGSVPTQCAIPKLRCLAKCDQVGGSVRRRLAPPLPPAIRVRHLSHRPARERTEFAA